MKKGLKIIGIIIFLAIIGVGVMGYITYSNRTSVPEVELPVRQELENVGSVVVEAVAEGVGQLWGLEFIPGTTQLLATERLGKLYLIDTASKTVITIENVPAVTTQGQGGLLDVAVSPEFAQDQTIFLTYAVAGDGGNATRVASAQLDMATRSLNNVTVLYTAPYQSGGTHFGSRLVVKDQFIYFTLGDRGDKNFEDHTAQNTQNPYGSIIRLNRDGSIPETNPFVTNPAVLDEIYSYGHRNPQGLTLRPGTTELWSSEHGEFQGDEINVIKAGGNYGWPEAHEACSYVTRRPFGVLPKERPDTVPPVFVWSCGTSGFPPAGMAFYTGDMFPAWRGSLLVSGLAGRYLARFTVTDSGLTEESPLLKEEGWRVRDVAVDPIDGAVYVAVEGADVSLVRIVTE
ncbi:MAG: PQQ-dependent sugar dehydrogenase [Patescibacteria group bacterium]